VNVLLVTGSRSLAGNREAERAVTYWFSDLDPMRVDLVVAGGSHGPDMWAELEARTSSVPYERWQLDGRVVESERPHANRRWCPEDGPPVDRRRVPLARNGAMVRHVAGLRGAIETLAPDNWTGPGYETRLLCVGFVDPNSRTHGTDHTLRLARQAGIWCARYVWQGTEFVEGS
jgi:hypothetical protein